MLHSRLLSDGAQNPFPAIRKHLVYVIDDEPELRASSCFLIEALGLSCIPYACGKDFLRDVNRLEPGCILLDVRMWEMSGLAVQQELLRRGVAWPIVFMSGDDDLATVVKAIKNGAIEFLEKPFNDEKLLAALHRGFIVLRDARADR
jgi:two-component system response regulator FixJ